MKRCPKCERQFDDAAKICRTCGSFLVVAEEETVPAEAIEEAAAQTANVPPEEAEPAAPPKPRPWSCPACKRRVPDNFDKCWYCGTNRDGTPDPDFLREPVDGASEEEQEIGPARNASPRPELHCAKCGSSKIIPKASVVDGHRFDQRIVVDGDPHIMIIKNRLYGTLSARVCGQCGHVELFVANPEELYEHYDWDRK
jgi:hypothetical protein